MAVLHLLSPLWGGGRLGATYDDCLRLIGKCVVDFLSVLIELFSLGVMAEALRMNIGSKSVISLQWGPVDPKFHVEVAGPPPAILFLGKLGLIIFRRYKNLDRSLFRYITTRLTDTRTDRRTTFSSLDRVCIPCSAVKIVDKRVRFALK